MDEAAVGARSRAPAGRAVTPSDPSGIPPTGATMSGMGVLESVAVKPTATAVVAERHGEHYWRTRASDGKSRATGDWESSERLRAEVEHLTAVLQARGDDLTED